jgi:hypothetical protein
MDIRKHVKSLIVKNLLQYNPLLYYSNMLKLYKSYHYRQTQLMHYFLV